MTIDMHGGTDGIKCGKQLIVRRLTLGDHAAVIVKKVTTCLAARLGNAQVDTGIFKLHAAQMRIVQRRIAKHHRIGANGFRRSPHELRQRVSPP